MTYLQRDLNGLGKGNSPAAGISASMALLRDEGCLGKHRLTEPRTVFPRWVLFRPRDMTLAKESVQESRGLAYTRPFQAC